MKTFLGLMLFAFMAASHSMAETYRCDAVDEMARLGYDGDDDVGIVGRNKICKFTIGNASADGRHNNVGTSYLLREEQAKTFRDNEQVFLQTQLAEKILSMATAFEDAGDFVTGSLSNDEDLSELSCDDGNTLTVSDLILRCVRFRDANPNGPAEFETKNSRISAVLFRPMNIVEVQSNSETEAVMVLFVTLAR